MDKPEKEKASEDQKHETVKEVVKEPTPAPLPDEKHGDDEDDDPFNFGGLPNRNLKKNLGCG